MPKNSIQNNNNAKPKLINFDKLPISELHNHVEGGTLTPTLVKRFAIRNGMEYKEDLFTEFGYVAYKRGDFMDFIRAYDEISNYVVTHDDVKDIVYDYLKRCYDEGAIYIELGCSPDHLQKNRVVYNKCSTSHSPLDSTDKDKVDKTVGKSTKVQKHVGLNYPDFVKAIIEGIEQARFDFGIEARIIMILLRHNVDMEGALEKVLDDIINYPHPYVVGLGLAGDEFRYPPERFQVLYKRAKDYGLKLTAHAGEFAGADSIRKAVQLLKLDRVGHGVNCHDDDNLMQLLVEQNIGLEICPTSNIHLDVFTKSDHPLQKIFNAGVKISINSDDPSFFCASLGHEWSLLDNYWDFNFDQKMRVARDSIEMSFADSILKMYLLSKIDLYITFQSLANECPDHKYLAHYKENPTELTLKSALSLLRKHCSDNERVVSLARGLEQKHHDCMAAQTRYDLSLKAHTKSSLSA